MDLVSQIKEKLDVADVIKSYLTLSPAGRNFKTNCPFHKEKSPSFIVSPERQIWHCFGCFPPGQKVKTPFGLHEIETIDGNHFVISGKGLVRKVLAAHTRNYKGDLVHVRVRKLGGVVSLTADHNLIAIRPVTKYYRKTKQFYRKCREAILEGTAKDLSEAIRRYGRFVEISAGDLQKDDFVLYPIDTSVSEPSSLNLKDYLTKSYTFGPRPSQIPYKLHIDDDFLKLIGYWIAEGSNHRAYIRFSLGNHEEDFAKEIASLIKKLFGLKAPIYRRNSDQKTGLEITACHAYLANIFGNLCGKGAANKHIPFIFQALATSKQKVLVEAILRGDGHIFAANRSVKKHKSITTVSRVLAEQIVDILLRNEIYPSLRIAAKKIDKKGVNHREAYTVVWSEEAEPQHNFAYTDGEAKYWLLPVKEIQKKPYAGPVYNLTVEQDHSYIAANFAVSNCGKGGDVVGFVMRYENLEFIEALKILAEKAGLDFKVSGSADQKEYDRFYQINQAARDFFKQQLTLSQSKGALDYFKDRGLKDETTEEFELGFAPDGVDNLSRHLTKLGYRIGDIERAGLVFKTDRGIYCDRFRNRLMFPLHNSFGKVVGFTGRIMPDADREGIGKYVNSPETPIFNKSKLLFGLHKSKGAIRETGTAVLVEGQMDFLMSWQDGVKNIVAASGTALTNEHLKLLKRLSDTLIAAFDSDEAGQMASERTIDLAQASDFVVKIVRMPAKPGSENSTAAQQLNEHGRVSTSWKDPADIVKEKSGFLAQLIGQAQPAMSYYFDRYLNAGDDIALKKKNIRVVLAKIKNIYSPIEKAHWTKELSARVGIDEKFLVEEMAALKAGSASQKTESGEQPQKQELSRRDLISQRLLSLVSLNNDFTKELEVAREYLPVEYQKILDNPGQKSDLGTLISLRSSFELAHIDQAKFIAEFKDLLRQLKLENLREKRDMLSQAIKEAEKNGDQARLMAVLGQFDNISKEIQNI